MTTATNVVMVARSPSPGWDHDRSAWNTQVGTPRVCGRAHTPEQQHAWKWIAGALSRWRPRAFQPPHGVRPARRQHRPVAWRGAVQRADQPCLAGRCDPHADRPQLSRPWHVRHEIGVCRVFLVACALAPTAHADDTPPPAQPAAAVGSAPESAARSLSSTTSTANPATRRRSTSRSMTTSSFEEDITTGDDAKAVIEFRDGSTFEIGPDAAVRIDSFIFNPEESTSHKALQVTRGVFRYVSGYVASDQNTQITTPDGQMGIRGSVAEGIVDPAVPDFVYLGEGSATFTNSAGSSALQPGNSIAVPSAATPPMAAEAMPAPVAAQALQAIESRLPPRAGACQPTGRRRCLAEARRRRRSRAGRRAAAPGGRRRRPAACRRRRGRGGARRRIRPLDRSQPARPVQRTADGADPRADGVSRAGGARATRMRRRRCAASTRESRALHSATMNRGTEFVHPRRRSRRALGRGDAPRHRRFDARQPRRRRVDQRHAN